jgi:hypothetical protein
VDVIEWRAPFLVADGIERIDIGVTPLRGADRWIYSREARSTPRR